MLNSLTIDLMKFYEGLRLKPYNDISGTPTIGYGNTFYEDGKKVTMSDAPITEQRAVLLFSKISNAFALSVKKKVTSEINENQLGALTSFAYNVGIHAFGNSTLLQKVNLDPNDESIGIEFAKWNKSKKKVIPGLTKRRSAEYELYKKKNTNENQINMKDFFIAHKKKLIIATVVTVVFALVVFIYRRYAK